MPDAWWARDTGTVELPRISRGLPLADQPTAELHLLDLRPPVDVRARRFRLRAVAAEFVRRDLADAWRGSVIGRGVAYGIAFLIFAVVCLHLGHEAYLLSLTNGGH